MDTKFCTDCDTVVARRTCPCYKGSDKACGKICCFHGRNPNFPLPHSYAKFEFSCNCSTCQLPIPTSPCVCHKFCSAKCGFHDDHPNGVPFLYVYFLDGTENICPRCRSIRPGGGMWCLERLLKPCPCCENCNVWCKEHYYEKKREREKP
jgi:hypothetical protein